MTFLKHSHPTLRRRLLLTLALLLGTAGPGLPATPAPAQLLGPDTLGVLTFPDWNRSKTLTAQWPVSQFAKDPAMKPFAEKFMNQFQKLILTPMEKEFGVQFSDYAGLAQGQLTLALTRNGWGTEAKSEPGFLLLMDARDKSDALQTALAQLKTKWIDRGKTVRTETIRDVPFSALVASSDDLTKSLNEVFPDPDAGFETLEPPQKKDQATQKEWFIGQSGPLLICGTATADIEKVLVRQSGGVLPTLGEDPLFAPAQGSLFRDALTYGWINLKAVIQGIKGSIPKDGDANADADNPKPTPDAVIGALGLNSLECLAFAMSDRPDGQLFTATLQAPGSERKGLLKMFAFEAKDAAPPPFVPADAVKFTRWRLGMQDLWNTLEATLTEIVPQMANVIKLLVDNAGKDQDDSFDLRKNLIANLGDDLITYEKPARGDTLADLSSPPSLFLIGSPRPDDLSAALKALTSLLPKESARVKEREFLGRTVYTLPLPPTPTPDGKSVPLNLTYVASGDYVALSTDTAMVEEFLRGNPDRALLDLPGLREAAQQSGGMNTGLFSFQNDRTEMRSAFEIMKKESSTLAGLFGASPLAGRLGMEGESASLKDWLDFSLLPPFETVAKYFHFSVYSANVDSQGYTLKAFSPRPPELR